MAQTGRLIRDYDGTWDGMSGESIARMRAQNKFRTGLDIGRYTARIMRADMAAYEADPPTYTRSPGWWCGLIDSRGRRRVGTGGVSTERNRRSHKCDKKE